MSEWQPGAFEAIIFDLDDTLYPESAYVLSGFNAVANWAAINLGISKETAYADLKALFFAKEHGRTFNIWLEKNGVDAEAFVPELVTVYRRHTPQISPFEDATPLLKLLRRTNYRTGLLSDGYLDVQKRKFAALQLETLFDAVVFSDSYGRPHWKPSTVPYLGVTERLKVDPRKAIYIADNPTKDFKGARASGMASIRVRRSDGVYAHLQPASADYAPDLEAKSLHDVQCFFQQAGFFSS